MSYLESVVILWEVLEQGRLNLFKRKQKRTLTFPQDFSLGSLYTSETNGYLFFAQAQGTVLAPMNIPLFLRINRDIMTLSPLRALDFQALNGLSIAHTNLLDQHLRDISSLTGLQVLHFEYTKLTGQGLKWLPN